MSAGTTGQFVPVQPGCGGTERPGGLRASSRGFSLVELLVVCALIVVLTGGLAFALRHSGGNALATGQTTLATLLGTARAQAAVHQTEAVLAIYANRPPAGEADKFLRLLQVFRNDTPGAAQPTWVAVGNPVLLPAGVSVVPPSTTGLLASGVVWPTNPPLLSTLPPTPINLRQTAGTPFGGAISAYTIQFNADGTVPLLEQLRQPYGRLVVATTAVANGTPQFNNAGAVRGLLIRPTGAVTFVNEALAF